MAPPGRGREAGWPAPPRADPGVRCEPLHPISLPLQRSLVLGSRARRSAYGRRETPKGSLKVWHRQAAETQAEYAGVFAEPRAAGDPDVFACQDIVEVADGHIIKDCGLQPDATERPGIGPDPVYKAFVLPYPIGGPGEAARETPASFADDAMALLKHLQS